MRDYWRQLRHALDHRIRYRITGGGVLFTLAIVMVGVGAVVSANNLLFLILAAMLATLLVSGLVSRLCLAGLRTRFLVPEHVPAGRAVPGKLFVRNQKWLMPSFSIRVEAIRQPGSPVLKSGVYFPLIAGGATLEENVEVRFPKRGAYRENSFAFSTAFPFGFLEKSARVTLRREMLVYPSIDPAAGIRRSCRGHRRRNRNPLPRPGQGLLPHTPLRGLRERPARRLEGHRPHRQPAGARIRARAGADRRDVPRPRRAA